MHSTITFSVIVSDPSTPVMQALITLPIFATGGDTHFKFDIQSGRGKFYAPKGASSWSRDFFQF